MRLDLLLVERALACSRTQAQKLIRNGQVELASGGDWQVARKTSEQVEDDREVRVSDSDETRFVSRAGLKLAGALNHLAVSAHEALALDVGQSTGGFSDCLLQAGAAKVIGIDVGHGQLASSLAQHPRLVSIEGINARHLAREHLQAHIRGACFDLSVMDVSFISQTLILSRVVPLMKPGSWLLSLVKPQFELAPEAIGKGGVVKDSTHYQTVRTKILTCAEQVGLVVEDYFESSIKGGDGNREFFLGARRKG